jgi:acetoin utilization protein AcuB
MLDNIMVREWMTSPVITISPRSSISAAHQIMKEHGIRRLVVTEKDVREASPSDATMLSIWELNYLWSQLTVERMMSPNVITVGPECSLIDAAELMLEHKVSGLPVMDTNDKLVGILTESDIFRMLVKSRSTAPIPRDSSVQVAQ